MRLVLLAATAAVGLALAGTCSASPALLTIPALHIYDKPIGNSNAMLSDGPIWDPTVPARPAPNNVVVIAGHDVTKVPGYGQHGPFYDLINLNKGYQVEIQWHDKLYRYRLVAKPRYHPEGKTSFVIRGGAVLLYSCYPRWTSEGRNWAEATLVSVTPLT